MTSGSRTRSGRPPGIPIRNREGLRVDLARLGERAEVARRLRQAVERDRLLLARRYPHLPQAATVWDWLDKGKPVGWPGHGLRDLARFIQDQTGKSCDAQRWLGGPPAALRVSGAPRRPSSLFRGRQVEFEALQQLLEIGTEPVSAAIEGLPGVGKTELALQLAYAFANEMGPHATFARGIFWLNAETRDLTAEWDAIARTELDLQAATVEERVRMAMRLLERSPDASLIVLDNAFLGPDERWERGRGQPFPLPESPRVRLLVTTRNAHFGGTAFRHRALGMLSDSDARELLLAVSGRDPERSRSALEGLEVLCEHLGGHPLAIEIAGLYLRRSAQVTPSALLQSMLSGEHLEQSARKSGYSVAKTDGDSTVDGAFRALWDSLGETTRRHWQLASLFEPAPVSAPLAQAVGLLPEALAELQELHLIEWDPSGRSWTMHRLTRAFAQARPRGEFRSDLERQLLRGCVAHAVASAASLEIYLAEQAHFDAALRLAAASGDAESELELALALGSSLGTRRGYADEQVRRLYSRALLAAEASGGHNRVARSLEGLMSGAIVRGDFKACAELNAQVEVLADAHDSPLYRLLWLVGSALIEFYMGTQTAALDYFDRASAFLAGQPATSSRSAFDYHVLLLGHSAMTRCLLGFPDSALPLYEQAERIATQNRDLGGLLMTWTMRTGVHHMRGELALMQHYAQRFVDVAERHQLSSYMHFGAIQLRWARLMQRPLEESMAVAPMEVKALRDSVDELTRLNFEANRLCALSLAADACRRLGRREDALTLCEEGAAAIERTGQRRYEPELWRVRAALAIDPTENRHYLERAEAAALEQHAPWWQLRSLIDLVEATQGSVRDAAACRLHALCSGFTEGRTLPDIERARRLLGVA